MSSTIPAHTSVLVIGGGPGGSYASAALRREGIDVVLLEATKFPRYHIGESMLPSMRQYLRFLDLEQEFRKYGFIYKGGAYFKLNKGLRETYNNFSLLGPHRTTWNVVRSESDDLLLRHAAKEGVQVFQETRVNSIEFEGDPETSRPISASWTNKNGDSGEIKFDWLVDASGRAGIMSTKYMKNRHIREGLRNTAVWGYWKDVQLFDEGTPWFEAMIDGSGWVWFIPLHNGTVSLGVVMHQDVSNKKKAMHPGGSPSVTEHYLEQLKLVPRIASHIGPVENLIPGSIKASADHSYFATRYSGDNFRVVGDAACFIDPLFSSGVHLAFTNALSAAATICASIKGEVSEAEAQLWHNAKVGIGHTRFLLAVLSAYEQMRNQSDAVLEGKDAEHYDKTFILVRPVIQGVADANPDAHLHDKSVDNVVDFCIRVLGHTKGDQNKANADGRPALGMAALSVPLLEEAALNGATPKEKTANLITHDEALEILRAGTTPETFGAEEVNGYVMRVQRGSLGLVKA